MARETVSKTFDCRTVKVIRQAERFKAMLENEGYSVETRPVGLDGCRITGTRETK